MCDQRHTTQVRYRHQLPPSRTHEVALPQIASPSVVHPADAAPDIDPHTASSAHRMQAVPADTEAGFTLLEILVVIAILGLLIGLVAPAALRQLGGARNSVAKQSIERIGSILELYKLDVGGFPSTDQGLAALNAKPAGVANWNGPYLKGEQSPMDPWSHPYVYRSPSTRGGHEYDLCSRGANNEQGIDQLICNP